jgi:hypothetical protein
MTGSINHKGEHNLLEIGTMVFGMAMGDLDSNGFAVTHLILGILTRYTDAGGVKVA